MTAIDLSHHLSDLAKARAVSPLKGMFKYIEKNPDIISVAGGESAKILSCVDQAYNLTYGRLRCPQPSILSFCQSKR
jgi:hypothetical protein